MKKALQPGFVFFLYVLILPSLRAQENFTLRIDSLHIENLPGLQSFTAAAYQHHWVLIGGRTDGLHMKQPFASFNPDYNNKEIVVVDLTAKKAFRSSVLALPVAIADQLQSSNMEFVQQDSLLFLFGGYGFSKALNRFITHPRVTILSLPQLIQAVKNEKIIEKAIVSIEDGRMAVTGGGAGIIGKRFLLAGGQKFSGRYNPHGPDHGPGFTQEYTNEIRSFELDYSGNEIAVKNYTAVRDTANLHRRDYNLTPQVFPDGSNGYTMFSGVFQYKENIPWLTAVNIHENGYRHDSAFQQQYSHYHSAHAALYHKRSNQMHTIFFGGIARYYTDNNMLREDKEIPFVNTISMVTRSANGSMQEKKLSLSMPGLLGASAWFAPNEELPKYTQHITALDDLHSGEQVLGYIIGGINSSAPNIFWPNTGKQSRASSTVFVVYINKN